DSGDRRKDPPLAEMLLHLIETAAKLLDKLIEGGKLNGGLCDFCLLRDDGFARRGILAQDFHSEGHSSRGHSAEALYRFLGHELIRASCFERVLRDSSLDAQFCRATGDVRQRAHVGGCCVGDAHESSGCAPAAFNGIRNVRIEAVDCHVHGPAPQILSANKARRTRGGTKSSRRDEAKMISEEYETNRAHFK